MEDPKQQISKILESKNLSTNKKRKVRKPKRITYFNAELVNQVYIKDIPQLSTSYYKNVSFQSINKSRKDVEQLSNINTEASNRDIMLNGMLTKSQNFSLTQLDSPMKLAVKKSERSSSQAPSLSRLSSKHSTDFAQTPQSPEQSQQMRKSKFNLQSESFLPKIQSQNGTLNEFSSFQGESLPSQSMTSLNQNLNNVHTSPISAQNIIFNEDNLYHTQQPQSQKNSPITKIQIQSPAKKLNLSQSQPSLTKSFNTLPHLGDKISLTKRQITLQKLQGNQSETKKIVSFAQDQIISVESDNNPTKTKQDSHNPIQKTSSMTKISNVTKDSKKYNKYASYLDLPPQNDLKTDLFKLIQNKSIQSTHSAQPAKQIVRNDSNQINSPLTPQQAAVVVPQPVRQPVKPKVDPQQIQIRKQVQLKFKKVKLRLRILLGFFNKLRKAAAKRREHFLKELQSGVLLREAINDIMKISMKVSRESFLMLFQEQHILDFYNYVKDRKNYILKRQRIRQYTFNIVSDYVDSSSKILEFNTSFIKFLSLHIRNFSHIADNFWPQFILDRLEFTKYGQIKNITQQQKEMVSIYLYFVFGICNRLVRPWQTLKIQEDFVKEKNAQLILSLTFYFMLDYIKELNPKVINNSFSQIPEQYQPKPRESPLNTYNDVLQKDKMFWVIPSKDSVADNNTSRPDFDKIKQELDSQKIINENVMIGLHPRRDLEDILKNDIQLRTNVQNCLKKGAVLLLAKVYSFNLNLNENLFKYVE